MAALRRNVWNVSVRLFLTIRPQWDLEIRRNVRALRRKPVRVLYPDSESSDSSRSHPSEQTLGHRLSAPRGREGANEKSCENRSQLERQYEKFNASSYLERHRSRDVFRKYQGYTPRGEPGEVGGNPWEGLRYDKIAPGDKRLAKVVTISKSKKFREKHGKILLEGRRLISDALEAGAVLETLFFSSVDSLTDFPAEKLKRANLVKVKFEDIKTWSDLVTPQGIIAIFNVPNYAQMKYPELCIKNCLPLSVICDNIRDPGNLGTILRCAAGAGCDKVLLTKGCVDVWEPKVLRAGMGAHFRIPLIANLEWESIPNYLSTSCKVFAADHHGLATLDQDVSSSGRDKDYAWVSSRQNPKVNQYKEWSSSDDDSDLEERKPTAKFHLPDVGIQCYHDLWAQGQTAVVIGGEAHGLSMEALELAESTAGQRLYIPLVPGMDSLNSGMAASILLFEAKRQLTLLKK